MNAPHLIYNGGDTKYTALLTSELDFNFEVADGASGRYFHLFTGNETRYKAVLSDITDELNPVQIWQGFLLPEQYSEPYTSNVFYVNFKFTDGIGSLKNKYTKSIYFATRNTKLC